MTVYFTRDHEWLLVEGNNATVGITDYAQKQLGDVVFVELPAVGRDLVAGKEAAVVESVKAASEVYAPADGQVIEANGALVAQPGLVNSDPQGDGWFFRMRIADTRQLNDLLNQAAYEAYIADLG